MSSWNFHVNVNGYFSVMIVSPTMQAGRLELNPWLIGPGSPPSPPPHPYRHLSTQFRTTHLPSIHRDSTSVDETWRYSSVVEYLPRMHKSLSSIPGTVKTEAMWSQL